MSGVVVGVENSETAFEAVKRAALVAEALGESLHLVMAVGPARSRTNAHGSDQSGVTWRAEAEQLLESIKSKAALSEATASVCEKKPGRAICAEAESRDASLIVVGNRHMQGASRILGAVASDVLRNASCDVLVAHTKAKPPVPTLAGTGQAESPRPAVTDRASTDIEWARLEYLRRQIW